MKASDELEYPLELTGAAFERMVNQSLWRISKFLDTLPSQPAHGLDGVVERARAVREPLPQQGESLELLLDYLFENVFPWGLNTASPGYLAYIPGGGLPHAAVADLISLVMNRYVGLWSAAPVVAEIEATVIRWLCTLAGYDTASGGFLTSGGSLANWAALVLARETKARKSFPRGVIYTSDQAHHSVAKAAMLAGFPRSQIRSVEVDAKYCLRIDSLRRLIDADRQRGLLPLIVVAQGGSTNTGAVDDLASLARLSAAEQLWLHVDAAYGGFFLFTERGRAVLSGIDQADSITLDPHKGLFLPYGTGCLVVRQRAHLAETFGGRGDYMTAAASAEFTDFCDLSPELSRDFRGLRIWLPLKMHGSGPFQRALDEKLDLAQYAAEQLRHIPGIEIVAGPQLSIVAFRATRAGAGNEELNRLNHELLDHVMSSRRVVISGTTLGETFVLRLSILSFRTHRVQVDECLELIRSGVESLRRAGEPPQNVRSI